MTSLNHRTTTTSVTAASRSAFPAATKPSSSSTATLTNASLCILCASLRVAYYGFPRGHARVAPVERARRVKKESGAQTRGERRRMKEACPELLGSWVYSGHERVDCVHEKRVINSYVATIETGRKHEVLLDRKNWGFCVRGEVATGGWEQPEARRRARGTENAVSSTHWRFLMHKREWRVGEIKRTRFFEPAENMGGQVAARRKKISTCRPVRSRKDYALNLRSFLTSAQTDNSSTLRQVHYDPPHRTEPFIDITMYIEDDTLFACTMHGVMKNIAYLLKRDHSNLGQGLLEEGRRLHHRGWPAAEINSRTLSAIAAYQERIATDVVSRKPVSVHIYEYFTQIAITKPNKIESAAWERRIVFVQVIFCLKEKNEMINSHRWFFNAFGRILQPNVCVLLDIGMTRP
ncbi:chitin synthase-domain-containing protein [Lactarius deliciosus]|nr:chitin synthase-domain-containing protein [Lactarius deliciosus]